MSNKRAARCTTCARLMDEKKTMQQRVCPNCGGRARFQFTKFTYRERVIMLLKGEKPWEDRDNL